MLQESQSFMHKSTCTGLIGCYTVRLGQELVLAYMEQILPCPSDGNSSKVAEQGGGPIAYIYIYIYIYMCVCV